MFDRCSIDDQQIVYRVSIDVSIDVRLVFDKCSIVFDRFLNVTLVCLSFTSNLPLVYL